MYSIIINEPRHTCVFVFVFDHLQSIPKQSVHIKHFVKQYKLTGAQVIHRHNHNQNKYMDEITFCIRY